MTNNIAIIEGIKIGRKLEPISSNNISVSLYNKRKPRTDIIRSLIKKRDTDNILRLNSCIIVIIIIYFNIYKSNKDRLNIYLSNHYHI